MSLDDLVKGLDREDPEVQELLDEVPVKPLEGEERKKTLHDMLSLLETIDNSPFEFTDAEVEALMFESSDKVDKCKYIMDHYSRNELFWRLEKYKAEKRLNWALNGKKRFMASMLKALENNNFEQFPGHNWVLKKSFSEETEFLGKVSEKLVINYPDLFKTKITPKLTEIKDFIRGGNEIDFARINQNVSVKFVANSELKLKKKTKRDVMNEQ